MPLACSGVVIYLGFEQSLFMYSGRPLDLDVCWLLPRVHAWALRLGREVHSIPTKPAKWSYFINRITALQITKGPFCAGASTPVLGTTIFSL